MPLVSMRQLLDHAAENGYGLPAFNVNNLEFVQGVMQAALNDPVTPLEFEKAGGIHLFEGQTADQVNRFGGCLTPSAHAAPQSSNGLHPRKPDPLRRSLPTVQHADFPAAPVTLPPQDVRARGGSRGKKAGTIWAIGVTAAIAVAIFCYVGFTGSFFNSFIRPRLK